MNFSIKTNKLKGLKMQQITMFEYPKFSNTKPIRLIELFGGIGCQAKALENLNVEFEHYRLCDFDKYAVQSYNAIHGTNFLPSDITQITAEDLGIVETEKYCYIMTYSFPCFTADSLVLTSNGYKNINEIKIGDSVLTHTNTYQKVTNIFNNGFSDIYSIKGMAIDEIKTTNNHKFYVKQKYHEGHKWIRKFTEPKWKEVKDLTKNDYLGISINQNSIIPEWNGIDFKWKDGRKTRHKNKLYSLMDNKDFWWIIGRYIGDGWIRQQGGVIICCAKNETTEITNKLKGIFNYSISNERTVNKIHIPLKELELFVSQFGKGAKNKILNNTIIDLPIELLDSFLIGYLSADGCFTNNLWKASSVSRNLIYGLAECVAKVYKTPYRIYKDIRKPKSIIENRIINQNIAYELVFKKDKRKQDKAFYDNGYIWYPINEIKQVVKENVYDIEVENDHSFTVQNTIVHNCTDLSLAGKQAGMTRKSGTRSGLLWEVERLLKESKELPQVLLMENVPQVHGKKNIDNFNEWCLFLESKGYKNYWQDLNSKNYGIPQSRNRTFMISLIGDYTYEFPEPIELTLRLTDMLENEVDEKYYLSEKGIKFVTDFTRQKKKYTQINGDIALCHLARNQTNWCGDFIAQPKLVQVAQLNGFESSGGGNREPKILQIAHGFNKGAELKICPSITTSSWEYNNFLKIENLKTKNKRLKSMLNKIDVSKTQAIDMYNQTVSNEMNTIKTVVNTNNMTAITQNYRIRKLTPKECWRLMGLSDTDFDKAKASGVSNSQLYKQAGNGIVVNVLMAIFKNLNLKGEIK